jgi:hypothetical protein
MTGARSSYTLDAVLIAIRLDKDIAAALATEARKFLISPAELVRRLLVHGFAQRPGSSPSFLPCPGAQP